MTNTTEQNCNKYGNGIFGCACAVGHCAVERERAGRATPVSPAPTQTLYVPTDALEKLIDGRVHSTMAWLYKEPRSDRVAMVPAAPAKPQPDLHSAIMNLPCDHNEPMTYKIGHRDARHAAAELVAAAQPESIDTPDAGEQLDAGLEAAVNAGPLALRKFIMDWHGARMAAAMRWMECDLDNALMRAEKAETALAAAREQALEEAMVACRASKASPEAVARIGAAAHIYACEDAIRALKSTPPSAPAGVEGLTEQHRKDLADIAYRLRSGGEMIAGSVMAQGLAANIDAILTAVPQAIQQSQQAGKDGA